MAAKPLAFPGQPVAAGVSRDSPIAPKGAPTVPALAAKPLAFLGPRRRAQGRSYGESSHAGSVFFTATFFRVT